MKFLLLSLSLLLTGVLSAQKLRFKVTGVKDTTVFLTRYYGKGLYYADTAVMKNGVVEFTAKSDLKPGVLALLLKDQKYYFIHTFWNFMESSDSQEIKDKSSYIYKRD